MFAFCLRVSSFAEFVVTSQQSYMEDKDCQKKNKESITYHYIILYYKLIMIPYIYIYIYI